MVAKHIDIDADDDFNTGEFYVYYGDDVLWDFVDSDGPRGNDPVLAKRYLHGPATDQTLAEDDFAGEVLWYIADNLGTVCVFTKPFNLREYAELAGRIAELGFGGIEASVRAGGNVEPEQVEDQLPRLVAELVQDGLGITTMATDVDDANDRLAERVLHTAAELGNCRYWMRYFLYVPNKSVVQQLGE